METSQTSQEEEEFIDMVVSPSSNHESLVQSKEFEFQMCKNSLEREAIAPSPADELFYKGKLLPLHLPPRLKMVQKLLHNPKNQAFEEEEEEEEEVVTALPSSYTTPQESCSISPTESCRASCEMNPDEYFFQWSTRVGALIGGGCEAAKKPWSKKMRLIKQSLFSQKLKSSRAYMKSLFTTRPSCTVEAKPSSGGSDGEEATSVSKAKEYVNKYIKLDMDEHISLTCHRLSFSGIIKRHSTSKYSSSSSSSTTTTSTSNSSNCSCSSSSFSMKSTSGFYEINLLKRSASANSEAGNSIEGAIAHCKKSQQKLQESSEEKRPQSEVGT